jgi:hypothetical protein
MASNRTRDQGSSWTVTSEEEEEEEESIRWKQTDV